MQRAVRATIVLSTVLSVWVLGAAVTSAQPALRRLEELIRRRDGGDPTKGLEIAPQEVGQEAGQQVGEDAEKALPERIVPERGYLGIVADDRQEQGRGVRILEVLPGGPADEAGLRAQDLITGLGSVRVRAMSEMAAILKVVRIGGKLPVEILRGGDQQQIEVTLGRRLPPEKRRFKILPPPADLPPVPPIGPPPETPPAAPQEPVAAPQDLAARVKMLQRRVKELERRVEQLERKVAELADAGRRTSAPRTAPVAVRVTYNGEPVEGAQVVLVPSDDDGRPAVGVTDAAGRAALTTFEPGDGAVPGTYRVTISKTTAVGTEPEAESKHLLPPKYAARHTSGLTVEVRGTGDHDFAFDLRD